MAQLADRLLPISEVTRLRKKIPSEWDDLSSPKVAGAWLYCLLLLKWHVLVVSAKREIWISSKKVF